MFHAEIALTVARFCLGCEILVYFLDFFYLYFVQGIVKTELIILFFPLSKIIDQSLSIHENYFCCFFVFVKLRFKSGGYQRLTIIPQMSVLQ